MLCRRASLLPVTALEFCAVDGAELLLAGEGPHLKLFSIPRSSCLAQAEVLPFGKIHGIRPAPPNTVAHRAATVAVFGQKSLRILVLEAQGNTAVKINFKTAVFEFSDWLLDVCWLDAGGCRLAAVTAHNVVQIFTITDGATINITSSYHSEVKCMLYSACVLGVGAGGVVIIGSGTVFNQILLWHIRQGEPPLDEVKVRLTLLGHEGVIFSLGLSEDESRLVSVSDDRTVRLWAIPQDWRQLERSEQQAAQLVLYGHTARVWDARMLPQCLVSVGEDATCRVWDYSGTCREVVHGHKGRSIWSLAVNGDCTLIATGGGDCSIRTFALAETTSSAELAVDSHLPCSGSAAASPDVPRQVALLEDRALCLTNAGILYSADVTKLSEPPLEWSIIHQDALFSGYSTMATSCTLRLIALGSLHGEVKILPLGKAGCSGQGSSLKVCKGKIFSLLWSSPPDTIGGGATELLFASAPEGKIFCFQVEAKDSGEAVAITSFNFGFKLPPSKHRWLSAVAVLQQRRVFIIGDRRGSLYVYHTAEQSSSLAEISDRQPPLFLDAVQSIRSLHGPNGVTCVEVHKGLIHTAGRDGNCRQFNVTDEETLMEVNKFKPVKGMDWIEQLYFTNKDLFVLGFHTTDLVLFSTAQNKCLLRVHCGGGHRSYGVSPLREVVSGKEMANAVFIKQSCVCLRAVAVCGTKSLVQQAFVGREAVSLVLIHTDCQNGSALVAVGSEDCTVCLLGLQLCEEGQSPAINIMTFLSAHISSVRALAVSPGRRKRSSRSSLLFSGGARASLKVWTIQASCEATAKTSLDAELFLHGKEASKRHKTKTASHSPPEVRVMSLAAAPLEDLLHTSSSLHYIAAGCSNGTIRQFLYDKDTRTFTELQQLVFHERCILVVEIFQTEQVSLLFTAATDGTVAAWLLDRMICQDPGTTQYDSYTKPSVFSKLHQSGINAIALSATADGCYMATGGDDNALALAHCRISSAAPPAAGGRETASPAHITLETCCLQEAAHSSSITGVRFLLDDVLVSTSVDQRVNLWQLMTVHHLASLELVQSCTHDVADAAAMTAYRTSDGAIVVLCGVGVQCLYLPGTQLACCSKVDRAMYSTTT